MVEVFKTNVQEAGEASTIISKLAELFPSLKINFDLSDCDKILRVEGHTIHVQNIIELVKSNRYHCEVLT